LDDSYCNLVFDLVLPLGALLGSIWVGKDPLNGRCVLRILDQEAGGDVPVCCGLWLASTICSQRVLAAGGEETLLDCVVVGNLSH
jgi:hypothetical protein